MPNNKKEKCQSVIRDLEVPSSATCVQQHFICFRASPQSSCWAGLPVFSICGTRPDNPSSVTMRVWKQLRGLDSKSECCSRVIAGSWLVSRVGVKEWPTPSFFSNSSAHMMGQFWLIKFFYSFCHLLIVSRLALMFAGSLTILCTEEGPTSSILQPFGFFCLGVKMISFGGKHQYPHALLLKCSEHSMATV